MECRECGEKFETVFKCIVHKKLHMYRCEHCGENFYSQKTLAEHEMKHSVECNDRIIFI